MRTFKFLSGLIFLFVMVSCGFNKYSEGVVNDTKEIFKKNKEYIYTLDFLGQVVDKKVCSECEINKYTITVNLKRINNKPVISNIQYPPYYTFSNDSTVNLSVNRILFEKAEMLDMVIKDSNAFTLKVNQAELQYLSEEEYKWLP